jgi:hypothetical protein
MPSSFYDFICDNAHATDSAEAEKSMRQKYPLLLGAKEKVVLAFKDRGGMGRDKSYFTTHRILIKDGKGIGSKRKNYKSIPWWSIEAFSTDTAGKFDGDVSVRIYSKGIDYIEIDLAADKVDIYQIQQFLNAKLLSVKRSGTQDEIDATPPNMDKKQSSAGSIIDWFGDNASQVDAKTVEKTFKTVMPVLLDHETVQISFKSGRYVQSQESLFGDMPINTHGSYYCTSVSWKFSDYTVLTDMRLLR